MAQPAIPLPVPAQMAIDLLNNLANGQLVTQADLVPLATQAQLGQMQAQVQAHLGQMQAQMQEQLGQMQALLAQHNAPAIAAAASATVQSIVASRMENNHDRINVVYTVVLRADGTQPPNWPAAGFNREALFRGPIAVVNTLLNEYGLPQAPHTAAIVRRNALAVHIGTVQV